MTSIGPRLVSYEDTDPSISYGGQWFADTFASFSSQNYHQALGTEVHLDIAFTGTNISVKADSWYDHQRFYCYMVDMPETDWIWLNQSIGNPSTFITYNLTMCEASGLPSGPHTLRMGMVAGDATVLDIDSYTLNTASLPGTKPVWRSHFPVVSPPAGYENTTLISTSQTSTTSSASSTTSTSTSTTASSTPSSKPKSSKSNDTALGVGVGVGTLAILTGLAFLLYWFWYRRRTLKSGDSSTSEPKDFGYLQGTPSSSDSVNAGRPPASVLRRARSPTTHRDPLTTQCLHLL